MIRKLGVGLIVLGLGAGVASAPVPSASPSDVEPLGATSTMSGVVRDDLGVPIEGVTVLVGDHSYCFQCWVGTSGADGTYTVSGIAPGSYPVFSYLQPRYASEFWTPEGGTFDFDSATPVSFAAGQAVEGIDVYLERFTMLTGRVVDSDGQPIAGAVMSVSDYGQAFAYTGAATDENGVYEVFALHAGLNILEASAEGFIPEYWTADGGTQDAAQASPINVPSIFYELVTVPDIELVEFGLISGTVTGPAGIPLPSATVFIQGGYCNPCHRTPDSQGHYQFENVWPADYYIYAQATGYAKEFWSETGESFEPETATVLVVEAQEAKTGIDIQLAPFSTVSGHIYDHLGNPAVGTFVFAHGDDCPSGCLLGHSQANGSFVASIEPGDYKLRAFLTGEAGEWWTPDGGTLDPSEAQMLVITSGQTFTDIDFTLPGQGAISFSVRHPDGNPFPYPDVTVFGPCSTPCPHQAYADQFGYGTRGDLSAGGPYKLQASKAGYVAAYWTPIGNAYSIEDAAPINVAPNQTTQFLVIVLDVDLDGDSLPNFEDPCPSVADCDGDGLPDPADPCPTVNEAGSPDTDGDLKPDACDGPGSGNVDCSGPVGGVNSVDALKVLRHSAGLSVQQNEPCTDVGDGPLVSGWVQGDVNCSGGVNSVDALLILRANAGLSVALPVGCPDIKPP